MLKKLLEHPLTRGFDIDAPETTEIRRRIIQSKPFLVRIYHEWYQFVADSLPAGEGMILEIGSGGGFFREFVPGLITSDVIPLKNLSLVLNAIRMPFKDNSLSAIVMFNVFHHITPADSFLAEAERCLADGGVLAMIEPWMTRWSRFVYTRLHHEPVDEMAKEWTFPSAGALSSANSALPWIVFHRDAELFSQKFPSLHIETAKPFSPFSYILSGGVSLRSLMPGFMYPLWHEIERIQPISAMGMFASIVIRKIIEKAR